MATTTPNRGYPYPNLPTDPNDIPGELGELADAIDADVCDLLTGIVGRPVARARGTGVWPSQSASGIGGATINRLPFDTIDFDPFGLMEFQNMVDAGVRMIRITQPGYYWAIGEVQVPVFTTAGVLVNYQGLQIRRCDSVLTGAAGDRLTGNSNNIATNADDGNVKLLTTAAGGFFDGVTDSFSLDFRAITTPSAAEFPVNERRLTIMRMTES